MGKLNSKHFPISKELDKDDILVIMGDAGFVWADIPSEKYWLKWLDKKPWTTFCVLGNHENYDKIEKLPTVNFCGAPAYQVSKSVFYAQTGNIYNLNGMDCLVINGADSHDIFNADGSRYRIEGISWWKQEQITADDVNKALANLARYNDEVDFVFSHTGGTEVCNYLGFKPTVSDFNLDTVLNMVKFKEIDSDYYGSKYSPRHFCGHYHINKLTPNKTRILYDDVMLIWDKNDH